MNKAKNKIPDEFFTGILILSKNSGNGRIKE
jgi:hypothetical protein